MIKEKLYKYQRSKTKNKQRNERTIMNKTYKPVEYKFGYSMSLWISLAVKSLRMGWPNGLRAAETAIGKSRMKHTLTCGIFEDVFPPITEIVSVMQEIKNLDYTALCSRQTHHGLNLTDAFCDMEHEAVQAAKTRQEWIKSEAWQLGIYLPDRAMNCFYTWLKLAPKEQDERPIDPRIFEGIPNVMADGHTKEGRDLKQRVLLLSGHYEQHRILGKKVMTEGWEAVRVLAHSGKHYMPENYGKHLSPVPQQNQLF